MRHEYRLADIGEGLEEAEIISWLVRVGDTVTRDQPLVEVMTDKSNAELPAPVAGTVVDLAGAVGDIIHVGGLIAVIEESAAAPPAPVQRSAVTAAAGEASSEAMLAPGIVAPAAPAVSPAVRPAVAPRPKASPSTRRAALERGIDLSTIAGSGPGGRILESDLDQPERLPAPEPISPSVLPSTVQTPAVGTPPSATRTSPVAEPPSAPNSSPPVAPVAEPTAASELIPDTAITTPQSGPLPEGTVPLRGVRRAVAQNMARAWAEIPHIHAFEHVDAEPLLEMRARLRETERAAYEALTPLSFFVAAVARALRIHPSANASVDMADETITTHPSVNVGIAVAAPHGLVVPVLRGADQLSFETLSLTLAQLIRGARDGSLSREHFQGGTVTITNFGSLGGEQAVPIIRPGESMIFGFGSIADRPFVVEEQVVARKTLHLVAGADHRLHDGDITTRVLNDVADSLTDPLRLVI